VGVIEHIETLSGQMTEWRRDLHRHPETAFEEHRTAELVARRLESFGIAAHRGLGKTGVVGQLKAGSEDFAFMLRVKPGCYVFIGNGPGDGGCLLHHPHYDFNDAILPLGANYWVRLTERLLGSE